MSSRKAARRPSAPRPRQVPEHSDLQVEPNPQIDFQEVPAQNLPSPAEFLGGIQAIQAIRHAPLLTLVACPDVAIRGDVIEQVYEQLQILGKVEQLDVFLHSAGGQTEIPWRLITLIRDYCDRFCVLVPSLGHSAATHLAMGADEIVMGPLSELSPVDPTRAHPLLPVAAKDEGPSPASVQDLRQCVDFVKSEIGDNSPEALAQVLSVLFDKVHPLAIGAIQQSYSLARLISRKALETHMDPQRQGEEIEHIVEALSNGFYSHGYRIGWQEAKEIGLKVTYTGIDSPLWLALHELYEDYRAYFANVLRKVDAGVLARPLVWIDTATRRNILEQIFETKAEGLVPVAPQWQSLAWSEEGPLSR